MNKKLLGSVIAFLCVFAWGLTFVSTKVLLKYLNEVEILFLRVVIAYITMWIIYPKKLKFESVKKELCFFISGLTGICLYYIFENVALGFTYASNVSIIVATSPLFIIIAFKLLNLNDEKLTMNYYIGFAVAIGGIIIMSGYSLNFKGDILALLSSIMWALYSVFMKFCLTTKAHIVQITRRVFFYGIITVGCCSLLFFDFKIGNEIFEPVVFLNIVFLSIIASAFAFIAWNIAIKLLGATASAAFIYLNPVVTVVASYFLLDEPISSVSILGTALVLVGLYLSEKK